MGEKPIGRRVALGVIGAGLTGIVFGSHVQDAMERVLGPITARDGTGLSSLFPVGRFRIYSVVGRLPERSDADYRLHVGGAVRTPLTLTLADLRAFPPLRLTKDFQCVTGWRVDDVKAAAASPVSTRSRGCCTGRSPPCSPSSCPLRRSCTSGRCPPSWAGASWCASSTCGQGCSCRSP